MLNLIPIHGTDRVGASTQFLQNDVGASFPVLVDLCITKSPTWNLCVRLFCFYVGKSVWRMPPASVMLFISIRPGRHYDRVCSDCLWRRGLLPLVE